MTFSIGQHRVVSIAAGVTFFVLLAIFPAIGALVMIAAGFAVSLSRPGGNITGISLMSSDLDGKRQDLLIEATPSAGRIAALADANVASLQHLRF
jgi:hypothetical protein